MPVISAFLGMVIKMYHTDHNPPHFHVQYGEFEAIVEIKTAKILEGRLPPRLKRVISEWTRLRRRELEKAWIDAQTNKMPTRIKPIE